MTANHPVTPFIPSRARVRCGAGRPVPADKAALVALLKETIATDRFPLSPWIKRLGGIPAKLGVGSALVMPLDAPESSGERIMALSGETAPVGKFRCPFGRRLH
jgi:hypothetical protein